MPDDNTYGLSRRKALLGLSTIGVAGVGAGIGTSALFSDEEEFSNNNIQAGTLDLSVEFELVDTSPEFTKIDTTGSALTSENDSIVINGDESEDADGNTVAASSLSLSYSDVKPGDWWVLKKTITIDGNPAYVNETFDPDAEDPTGGSLTSNENTNDENGQTEPESDVDGSTGAGNGELGRFIRVHEGNRYTGDSASLNDGADGDGVGGNSNDAYNYTNIGSNTSSQGENPANYPDYSLRGVELSLNGDNTIEFGPASPSPDIQSPNPANLFFQGTLNHFLFAHSADFDNSLSPESDDPVLGDIGNGGFNGITMTNPASGGTQNNANIPVNHEAAGPGYGFNQNNTNYTAVGPTNNGGDVNDVVFYQKFFVPREVGNIIQSDSISYTYTARAEQVRNNPTPSFNQ